MEHSLLAGESRSKRLRFVKSCQSSLDLDCLDCLSVFFLGHICGLFLNSGTF